MAHDAANQCQIGDLVLIEECRPLSKRKRWLVRNIIERAA
jgi:small subunit ribosomal protein S17